MKPTLTGAEYLESVFEWKAFVKEHPNFAKAIRSVLDELYYLRKQNKKLRRFKNVNNNSIK